MTDKVEIPKEYQKQYKKLKLAIILSTFTEGLLSSQHLAIFFMYSEFFKIESETYQVFETIINFKFILIPFMGYVVGHYKIFGHAKRSYLIMNSLIGVVCYSVLAWASA